MHVYLRKKLFVKKYKLNKYKHIHVYIFKIYTNIYYIYIINIHSTHTYIMSTKTFMLDAINHINCLTALIYIHYIAKSIGPPLLMKDLTTLVISISINLNV